MLTSTNRYKKDRMRIQDTDIAMADRVTSSGMDIEAEVRSPLATAQIVRYYFAEAPDSVIHAEGKFRIELCLTSRHRSARACFRDQWNAHRFEKIGEIFLAPPDASMLARSDESDPMTSIVCNIDRDYVLDLFETLPELTDQHLMSTLDIRDPKIRHLLIRVAEEARCPGFASEMMVDMIAGQLSLELIRHGYGIADRQMSGGLASWQLRLIDERLRDIRAAPSLPDMADLCRVSVRQLTRGFRISRDCSIGAYVTNSQMEHAKRLLDSDESVASIAETLGFSSGSNFSFAFRRATGMSPGEFRHTLLRH